MGSWIVALFHTVAEPQPKKPARRPAAANNGCPTKSMLVFCLGQAVFFGVPVHEAGDFGWLKTSDWDGWVEAFDDALYGDQDFTAGAIEVIRHQDSFARDQENLGS